MFFIQSTMNVIKRLMKFFCSTRIVKLTKKQKRENLIAQLSIFIQSHEPVDFLIISAFLMAMIIDIHNRMIHFNLKFLTV